MSKITNHTKTMKIVKLDDGSAIFMRSGQIAETTKKIQHAPEGVSVKESNPKRQKTPKTQTELDDDQIPEENS